MNQEVEKPYIVNAGGLPREQVLSTLASFAALLKASGIERRNKDALVIDDLLEQEKLKVIVTGSLKDESDQQMPFAFGMHLNAQGFTFTVIINANGYDQKNPVTTLMSSRFKRFLKKSAQEVAKAKRTRIPIRFGYEGNRTDLFEQRQLYSGYVRY